MTYKSAKMKLKARAIPPAEASVQIRQAALIRSDIDWSAFTLDYKDESEGTNRYRRYFTLNSNDQSQVIAFTLWLISCTTDEELEVPVKEVIALKLNYLDNEDYQHIKAWVQTDEQISSSITTEVIEEFIESLSYSDWQELKDISEAIFGKMKSFQKWLRLVLNNKYAPFRAKEEFTMSFHEPICYHEPWDYQNARRENWF